MPAQVSFAIARDASASGLNPLSFCGDKRGRNKALLFALLNGTSTPDPEPVSCSCDPGKWARGRYTPETSSKDIISARISFFPSRCNCTVARLAAQTRGARLLQLRELRRVWSRLLILCCDPTTVAHLCSQNAVVQASLHTATHLPGPRLASGAFAVAQDEGRNRFFADRRPLDGSSHFGSRRSLLVCDPSGVCCFANFVIFVGNCLCSVLIVVLVPSTVIVCGFLRGSKPWSVPCGECRP